MEQLKQSINKIITINIVKQQHYIVIDSKLREITPLKLIYSFEDNEFKTSLEFRYEDDSLKSIGLIYIDEYTEIFKKYDDFKNNIPYKINYITLPYCKITHDSINDNFYCYILNKGIPEKIILDKFRIITPLYKYGSESIQIDLQDDLYDCTHIYKDRQNALLYSEYEYTDKNMKCHDQGVLYDTKLNENQLDLVEQFRVICDKLKENNVKIVYNEFDEQIYAYNNKEYILTYYEDDELKHPNFIENMDRYKLDVDIRLIGEMTQITKK